MANTEGINRKPNTNHAYGIEIEMMVHWDHNVPPFVGFFVKGYDGSIQRHVEHDAYEMVSQPLSYHFLQREIMLLGSKFPWVVNASCGIHVHVTRDVFLSDKKAKRIFAAVSKLTDDQCIELFGRKPNDYCKRQPNYRGLLRDRYTMVNFTNIKTFEFRMFASGDWRWAQECVRRVRAMIRIRGPINYQTLRAAFFPSI